MATLSTGYTFGVTEQVTNTKLSNLVNNASISDIANADISASANIADSKLADITTGNKVRGTALGNLASSPQGAGVFPGYNIVQSLASGLIPLFNSSFPQLRAATMFPYYNLVGSLASGAVPVWGGGENFVGEQRVGLKIGSFTFDLSTATGSQSYTGVGFKPRLILFFAAVNGVAGNACLGLDNGSTTQYFSDNHNNTNDAYEIAATASIRIATTGSGQQKFAITSMDADGFTGTWTKTNSPTGTLLVFYLAIR